MVPELFSSVMVKFVPELFSSVTVKFVPELFGNVMVKFVPELDSWQLLFIRCIAQIGRFTTPLALMFRTLRPQPNTPHPQEKNF